MRRPVVVEEDDRDGPDITIIGDDRRKAIMLDKGAGGVRSPQQPRKSSGGSTNEIEARCVGKWPGDFSMQEFCARKIIKAADSLNALMDRYNGSEVWSRILIGCNDKWADRFGVDYVMVDYCAKKQVESARRLGKL
jgi:hypothetical protein